LSLPKFTWDIDPVFLHIPLPWDSELGLRYYSLLFVFVFLGGYALLNWQIRRGGGTEEDAGDFIVYGVIGVLGGARLGHVLFYDLDKALRDPIWVLKIWTGGLASHGAVIGLIVAMYLFTKRRGIPFLEGSDRFAFSAALGATLVRLGNFFNSEIVGRVTDQSWGVQFPRYDHRAVEVPYRYPSQLFETAMGLVVLGALVFADRAWGKEKRPRGALISLFFALYFPGRFLVEYYKEYQTLPDTSALTMGQWLSIPGACLGFYGLWWSFKHRLPVGWELEEPDDDYDDYDDDYDDYDDERDDLRDADVDEEFGARRPRRTTSKRRKSGGSKRSSQRSSARATASPDDDGAPPPRKRKKKKKRKKSRSTADTMSDSPRSKREKPDRPKKKARTKKVQPRNDADDE
jgi:phosphatidylglycerol:prolipoprotein diacylglycerol transferase